MNEIKLSDKNFIQVETIDRLTANAPFVHEDRIAKMNVLIYVLDGCIYVTEDDEEYEVGAGEVLLLKKGTHQYGQGVTMAGTSWIYVHFQICGDDVNRQLKLPKYVDVRHFPDIKNRLLELYELGNSDLSLAKYRISSEFQLFLLDMYDVSKPAREIDITDSINTFLKNNLTRDIGSNDLEAEFHLSYKYLAKLYKGNSIMKYHFQHRMLAAAQKLRSTNEPVAEIGSYFGYDDPLYFSKCFKKYMGVSPREYRKQVIRAF